MNNYLLLKQIGLVKSNFFLFLVDWNVNCYYVYFSSTPTLPYSPTQESIEKFLRNGITLHSLTCSISSLLPTPYSLLPDLFNFFPTPYSLLPTPLLS